MKEVNVYNGLKVIIEFDKPTPVNVDGSLMYMKHVKIQKTKKNIKFLV